MQDALAAIAHQGRRKMLGLVLEHELTVGEIARRTGMSQPATSQQLKVLRDAGLVEVRVDGPRRLYRVDFEAIQRLRSELDAFWGGHLDALRRAAEQRAP